MTPSQAIRAINEVLGWPRSTSTVMIPGETLDEIAGVVSHIDMERRVAYNERRAAENQVKRLRGVVRLGIAAVLVQVVAMAYMAYAHGKALQDAHRPVIVMPHAAPMSVSFTHPRRIWRV